MYNNNPYLDAMRGMPQGQPIRTLTAQPTQSECFFAGSEADMDQINPMPNTVYVGLNKTKNEIYILQMANSGLTERSTYVKQSAKSEKPDISKILERLSSIEEKMKGLDNGAHTNSGATVPSGTVAEPPADAVV